MKDYVRMPGFDFSKPVGQRRSPYYRKPGPVHSGRDGFGGYLSSDETHTGEACPVTLRVIWCDEVEGSYVKHTGWYSDDDGIGETIRGIVARLPGGRGFLAGWAMGGGMCCEFDSLVWDDIIGAVNAADSAAMYAAERAREDSRKFDAAREAEAMAERMAAAREEHSELCAIAGNTSPALAYESVKLRARAALADWREAAERLRELWAEYGREALAEL